MVSVSVAVLIPAKINTLHQKMALLEMVRNIMIIEGWYGFTVIDFIDYDCKNAKFLLFEKLVI